jgi:hypothetical protein
MSNSREGGKKQGGANPRAKPRAKKKKKVEERQAAGGAVVEAREARAEGKVVDIRQGLLGLSANHATDMRRKWHRIFIDANILVQDREAMINAILKLLPSGVDHVQLDDDASIEELKSVFLSFEFIPPWLLAVLRPDNSRQVFDKDAASIALSKCLDYLSTSEHYEGLPVHGKSNEELLETMQSDDGVVGHVQGLFFCLTTKVAKDYIRALMDEEVERGRKARHYLQRPVSTQFNLLFTENVVKVRIFIHARLNPRFQNL